MKKAVSTIMVLVTVASFLFILKPNISYANANGDMAKGVGEGLGDAFIAIGDYISKRAKLNSYEKTDYASIPQKKMYESTHINSKGESVFLEDVIGNLYFSKGFKLSLYYCKIGKIGETNETVKTGEAGLFKKGVAILFYQGDKYIDPLSCSLDQEDYDEIRGFINNRDEMKKYLQKLYQKHAGIDLGS